MKKLNNLGWVAAAAMASAMIVSGFQGSTLKFGSVDIGKVIQQANFAKKTQEDLSAALKLREDTLTFLQQHRNLSPSDFTKYRQVSTRNPASAGDKSEIERITNEATRLETLERDLSTKAQPTDADRRQIDEFATRKRTNTNALQQFNQELQMELQQLEEAARGADLEKARAAVKEVASKQGYSVVLTSGSAAYAANDITDDVIKTANKKAAGQ